jgi:hypothetical protein
MIAFLEHSETPAEMRLIFTFVLLEISVLRASSRVPNVFRSELSPFQDQESSHAARLPYLRRLAGRRL